MGPILADCGRDHFVRFALRRIVRTSGRRFPHRRLGHSWLRSHVGNRNFVVHGFGDPPRSARDVSIDLVLSLATWFIVSGIIGGRLFYLIQYWHEYRNPNIWQTIGSALNFAQGGLVVYGAFLGGFFAYCYFVWRNNLSFLRWADMVVPCVMLGLALGRIGCFCNGCCYGGPTQHWWGVHFPTASVPYAEHRSTGRLHGFQIAASDDKKSNDKEVVVTNVFPTGPAAAAGLRIGDKIRAIDGYPLEVVVTNRAGSKVDSDQSAYDLARSLLSAAAPNIAITTGTGQLRWKVDPWPQRTEPIQPTQLYSALTAGLICLFLLAIEPFLSQPGSLFGIWISVYPPARFLLESIRVDESSFAGSGLSIAQNISVAITVLAVGFWFYQWKQRSAAVRLA